MGRDRQKQKAYNDTYYQANRERILAWRRAHREANKERERAKDAEYRRTHKEILQKRRAKRYQAHKEQNLARQHKYKQQVKLEVFSHYSPRGVIRCARCGNANIIILCIDHIEGGGTQARKLLGWSGGNGFYHWLRKQGYPKGYQVLCFNCNALKAFTEDMEKKKYDSSQV